MSKEYVLITTINHFRMYYAVPMDDFEKLGYSEPIDVKKLSEYIADGHIKEISQESLGENVVEVEVYDENAMLTKFNSLNSYLSGWSNEKKIEYLNKWQDEK